MSRSDDLSSTAILVLGMHRSGTSATTRILNMLGVHLGEQLLSPQADNKKGFWEHAEAVDIHERLLSALGRNWHDTREMPEGWTAHASARIAVDEIVELIRRDMSGHRLWAVKDPRMCRLIPLWLEALERLSIRITVIMVVREPLEVARSLSVRDGWTHAHAYLMWIQHFLESFRSTKEVPRAILSYDELMSDWAGAFRRIEKELGVSWDKTIDEVFTEVDAFLSPEERHHYASHKSDGHVGLALPPKFLQQLYKSCQHVVHDSEGWGQIAECDRRYREFVPVYGGLINELTVDRHEFERLAIERLDFVHHIQLEHTKTIQDNSRQHAELVTLHEQNAVLQRENTALQGESAVLQQESARLKAESSKLEREISRLQGKELELVASVEKQMQHVDQLTAQCTGLENEVSNYRRRYSDLEILVRSRRWLVKRLARLIVHPSLSRQNGDEGYR